MESLAFKESEASLTMFATREGGRKGSRQVAEKEIKKENDN